MTTTPGDNNRFRLRVEGERAHTDTGWSWWYAVHDMTRPEGHRITLSGSRWHWREAMCDGIEALCAQYRLAAGLWTPGSYEIPFPQTMTGSGLYLAGIESSAGGPPRITQVQRVGY